MLRYLLPVIELALLVYCLIDCIQTDSVVVRNLSKPLWIVLIIVVPVIGPVAWLVAGRPEGRPSAPSVPWPSTATAGFPEYERPRPPRGPDDDPTFLAGLAASDREHERMLAEWEATLREREERLRAAGAATGTDGAATSASEPGQPPAAAGADDATPGPEPKA